VLYLYPSKLIGIKLIGIKMVGINGYPPLGEGTEVMS